jgi:hypothetical protein
LPYYILVIPIFESSVIDTKLEAQVQFLPQAMSLRKEEILLQTVSNISQ